MSYNFIKAKVIAVTTPVGVEELKQSEDLIAYCARVSNPENQANTTSAARLLSYLMRNKHWSPFEMANCVIEVECPRDIARQLLRHRSFSFQEFSQRYSTSSNFITREARLQDEKNRQNSVETSDSQLKQWWEKEQRKLLEQVQGVYEAALAAGIAKEQARCILPEGLTMSRLYVNGTIRSWLHYVELRSENGTQKEHRDLAVKCGLALAQYFPSLFIDDKRD